MGIALEDVDRADGVGTQKAERHEAEACEEREIGILCLVRASQTKDDGANDTGEGWDDEVDKLVFRDADSAFLRNTVCHPVGGTSSDQGNSDSRDEDRHEAEAKVHEVPSVSA